ncbi:8-oxo-dGTP diphosphatase MutT [Saccharospirillum impatiens]|uniref:8-oxo-dGTP diphosphatase MutT n=1 Tax=Saccharospirillum impatiens TaxID=169438 RepID=UPI000402F72A|nr:8-oxo-dGTP diphosphatase MutT [Saccharospirillum impatiens]
MSDSDRKTLHVAVGIVVRDDQVLIAKRQDHQHQGGFWEFPGGKVEAGETAQQALVREFQEEVGLELDPTLMTPLMQLPFDYGDRTVQLDTWICHSIEGIARGCEGQLVQWVAIDELDEYSFPEANAELIAKFRQTR